jgi:protease II
MYLMLYAGGLAIAAAVHQDPSVCAAALLDVPFLDVVGGRSLSTTWQSGHVVMIS